MKKFSLDIQPDFDFKAIGIVCHAPDYKLCYNINLAFNWSLTNFNRHVSIETPAEEIIQFPYFEYAMDDAPVILYNNKSGNRYLLPSNKDADYILVLHQASETLLAETLKNLRKVKTVLFTYTLDLEKISNKTILLLNNYDEN